MLQLMLFSYEIENSMEFSFFTHEKFEVAKLTKMYHDIKFILTYLKNFYSWAANRKFI